MALPRMLQTTPCVVQWKVPLNGRQLDLKSRGAFGLGVRFLYLSAKTTMFEFSLGLIVGIMIMRVINAFSKPFKEDVQGQEIVYNKGFSEGFKEGYAEATIEHAGLR